MSGIHLLSRQAPIRGHKPNWGLIYLLSSPLRELFISYPVCNLNVHTKESLFRSLGRESGHSLLIPLFCSGLTSCRVIKEAFGFSVSYYLPNGVSKGWPSQHLSAWLYLTLQAQI